MLPAKENLTKIKKALLNMNLFPVDAEQELSAQTLKRKYHELAFRLHPDKKGSQEEFLNLRISYDILLEALNANSQIFVFLKRESSLVKKPFIDKDGQKKSGKPKASDPVYLLYKKASEIYSEALEDYFENTKQVNLCAKNKNYQSLHQKLTQCKQLLAEIIKKDPGGIWTSDAIEKVASINLFIQKH